MPKAIEVPELRFRPLRGATCVYHGSAVKAFAVIGVRRSGKTSLLAQCRDDGITAESAKEAQLLLSLEDERLSGIEVADLPDVAFPGARASCAIVPALRGAAAHA